MKTNKIISVRVLCIAFTIICGNIICPSTSASDISSEYVSESSVSVILGGDWKSKIRSLLPSSIPFTASTNSYTLYIQNAKPDCDIAIQIVNEVGQTVFEAAVSKDESSYIAIPIDALQDGYYTLEIRNATGGYVYGSFLKDTDSF